MKTLAAVCLVVVLSLSGNATIPEKPLCTFALTNATSAFSFNEFVVATTYEGVMCLLAGYPQSQLPLPSPPIAVRQDGNIFLVQTRSNELFLITVSDVGKVILLHRFDPGGVIEDYAFDYHTIYIARGFDGLHRYVYTLQGGFAWTDSSQIPVHCTDLVLNDSLLFAVDDYNGIIVYNVSNGTLDRVVDRHNVKYQINDLAVIGRYVAATTENDVMLGGVFDWGSDSFSSLDSVGSVSGNDIYFQDSIAYAFADDSIHLRRWIAHPTLRRSVSILLTKSIRPSIGVSMDIVHSTYLSYTYAAATDGTIIKFSASGTPDVVGYSQYTSYSGPFTHIQIEDSTIYVAGTNFPLQSFHFDLDGDIAFPKVVIPGILNVRGFDLRHDSLLVLSPADRAVLLFSIADPVDPVLLRQIAIDTNMITEARFVDWPSDTMTVISMSGVNHVLLYTIRDTLPTENTLRVFTLGRVLDYKFVDSLVVILTNKKLVDIYKLDDDLTSSFVGSTSTTGSASSLVRLDQPNVFGSDSTHSLYLVSGTTLSRLDLSVPSAPFFDLVTNVGFAIEAASVLGDTIFAVGPGGLARFELHNQIPVLKEIGGRPGKLLSRQGQLVATSAGESVFLYGLTEDVLTDVDDDTSEEPVTIDLLSQNWPNPFNPETTIRYSLPNSGPVRLAVYNILGQKVTTLVDMIQPAGSHTANWDGRNGDGQPVASGLYLYRLELSDRAEARKMMLIR